MVIIRSRLVSSFSTTPLASGSLIFLGMFAAIWTSSVLAEQICLAFLLVIKSRTSTMIAVSYILCVSLILASGTVRSFKGIQPWLQENTKGTHTRYASMLLHNTFLLSNGQDDCVPSNEWTCPNVTEYILQRMGRFDNQVFLRIYTI